MKVLFNYAGTSLDEAVPKAVRVYKTKYGQPTHILFREAEKPEMKVMAGLVVDVGTPPPFGFFVERRDEHD